MRKPTHIDALCQEDKCALVNRTNLWFEKRPHCRCRSSGSKGKNMTKGDNQLGRKRSLAVKVKWVQWGGPIIPHGWPLKHGTYTFPHWYETKIGPSEPVLREDRICREQQCVLISRALPPMMHQSTMKVFDPHRFHCSLLLKMLLI